MAQSQRSVSAVIRPAPPPPHPHAAFRPSGMNCVSGGLVTYVNDTQLILLVNKRKGHSVQLSSKLLLLLLLL